MLIVNLGTNFAFCNEISIDVNNSPGHVNKKVFGNNLLGYDPKTYEKNYNEDFNGYYDFGAGMWDSKWKNPSEETLKLAKVAGLSILRFPGGSGANRYNWRDSIAKNRGKFLFGIDEFLDICRVVNAEAVFTVGYYVNDENDMVDLIKYLNEPNQSNKNKSFEPKSRIEYFEIGNELWGKISPEEYANCYLKYYDAMKKEDPTIKVGLILNNSNWNEKVLQITNDKLDFGVVHIYPTPPNIEMLDNVKDKEKYIFKLILAKTILSSEYSIQSCNRIIKDKTGQNIPLAITEYNVGFHEAHWNSKYRHCLGSALVNAELLHIFMKPENNILMANYWNFVNEYWGMIANGFRGNPKDLYNPYYRRPNYYVFEMYAKHFGDILIEADVNSDFYDVSEYTDYYRALVGSLKKGKVEGNNLIEGEWNVYHFMGVNILDKGVVLGLEFKDLEKFNYYHAVKHTAVESNTYYCLSGYIKTDELIDKDNNGVCLEVQDGRGWSKTHSAISTEKIKGTTDWQYVEVLYGTLPDASSVKVIARRIGEVGPLQGKAFFKDVKLEKFIPDIDTKIPYLSVNASKSKDGKTVYLMVVNKNLEEDEEAKIVLDDFEPSGVARVYTLWGKTVDATNEKRPHNDVKIYEDTIRFTGSKFKIKFKKHSLTAVVISERD